MIGWVLSVFAAAAAAGATPLPAKTDDEVWALAERVHAPEAYMAYWKRFRAGTHVDEAVNRYWKLKGIPAPPPVPRAPSNGSAFITPLAANEIDPCSKMLVDYELGASLSEEGKAFVAARLNNRVGDYEAYLAKFPSGVCSTKAIDRIETRKRLRASFTAIPGFGPLAAQRISQNIVTGDDYPPSAIDKGEQGKVIAEWDVAEDGIAESCRVVQSSGSDTLDRATCRMIVARMRYDPARDPIGTPMRSTDRMPVLWSLPPEPTPTPAAPISAPISG